MAKTTTTTTTAAAETGGLLIPKIAKAAIDLIHRGLDTYWAEGGIDDTKAALTKMQQGPESVSNGMLELARLCLKETGNDYKAAAAEFQGATRKAEEIAKQEAKARKDKNADAINKLLPSWPSPKSTCFKALEKGLKIDDTSEYPNYSAVASKVRARGTQSGTTDNAKAGAVAFKATEQLRVVLAQIHAECSILDVAGQNQAAAILLETLPLIQALRPDAKADTAAGSPGVVAPSEAAPVKTAKRERAMRGGRKAA